MWNTGSENIQNVTVVAVVGRAFSTEVMVPYYASAGNLAEDGPSGMTRKKKRTRVRAGVRFGGLHSPMLFPVHRRWGSHTYRPV